MAKKKKINYAEIARRVMQEELPNPSDVRKLIHAAINRNAGARKALVFRGDEIAEMVNTNMKAMQREGYDYGNAYGLYEHFTDSEYYGEPFKTAKELKKDWEAIGTQLMVGARIMSYKDATVAQQKAIEIKRIRKLKELDILPKNYSFKNARNFLRFLGREETKEIVGEYGNSNTVVKDVYKAYTKKGNTVEKLSKAFTEYLAQRGKPGQYDYFDMMIKLGVTI